MSARVQPTHAQALAEAYGTAAQAERELYPSEAVVRQRRAARRAGRVECANCNHADGCFASCEWGKVAGS
jgi:hypothetical protein